MGTGTGQGKTAFQGMARMLGRLQWVARPVGASSPFLAGAYRSMHAPSSASTRALARSTATSLLFSIPQHKVRATTHTRRETIFADAAPLGRRFQVGVVGRLGMYRQEVCPAWVTNLQQAELYAGYVAMRIAAYRGVQVVNIGFDNDAARVQCASMQAITRCNTQQRLLRRMFWLRAWADVDIACFRVPSACNPADSLSRAHEFPAREDAIAEAEWR